MYQQICSGVAKPDNCSVSCLNVLLYIMASDFKEPFKMQQGITAMGSSVLLIFHMFITSHKILARPTDDQRGSWTAPEGNWGDSKSFGQDYRDSPRTHPSAGCMPYFSNYFQESPISILVPKENIHILCFVKGSYQYHTFTYLCGKQP